MSCGVGHFCGSALEFALAVVQASGYSSNLTLVWELPYVEGSAQKRKKKKKKRLQKVNEINLTGSNQLQLILIIQGAYIV